LKKRIANAGELFSKRAEVAANVSRWLDENNYRYRTLHNDYTVLDVDAKIVSYTINICVPSREDLDCVQMNSTTEMNEAEKKALDHLDERMHRHCMWLMKAFLLNKASEFELLYSMEPCTLDFQRTRLIAVIDYKELNKKRFLNTISGIVHVFDQLKIEHSKLLRAYPAGT
jgi:hypothetical protein